MKYKILSIFIVLVFAFSFAPVVFAGAVSIPDSNLSTALHDILGVANNQQITSEQLAGITGNVNLSGLGISNMDGVQYLTGATSIDLSLNSIGAVPREIENLTSLESLDLSGNKLTRLPSNLGGLSSLKNLDIRANRLAEIPSALTSLTLTDFKCDYNFLDVSDGSSARNTINLISAQNKYFEDQLTEVVNFSAYSPQSGSVVLYWDEMENIHFSNGVIGEIVRFSVLDSGYSYIGEAKPYEASFQINGLDTTTEYTFRVSADYYVKGTKYDGRYTKLYKDVKVKAVPQNTPTPEASATETPTPTLEPETPTPEPQTPTPTQQAATPTHTPAPIESQENEKTGGAGTTIYIIIIVLAAIFVFITLLIIMRAIAQRKHRNSRYRR